MLDVIEQSEFFDSDWYDEQYPDARMMHLSPAEHYLAVGARLRRDPGPKFSTAHYLHTYPDVAKHGVNPLWHYEQHGRAEGRAIAPSGSHRPPPLPARPTPRLDAEPLDDKPARVVAFYLPQFHPIPENDEWWGEGFTEWTNVRPAGPWMSRHHQPHVPGELGYYDLRDTEVQRRQIELAKLYGLEGFCFYFYWFAGKRLLETPVRNYLEDSSLDMPFMLCWANENWSRRWDGRDDDVLIGQEHSADDDLAFIEHIADYLRDPRYIRVDGKPMLLVYRPNLLPDPKATVARWRTWCRENGVGEIHLAYTQSFESVDPRIYDFDAAIEFPPNNSGIPDVTDYVRPHPDFEGWVSDWSPLAERSERYASPSYPLHRGVCPSWDNTPRRGAMSRILVNNTPGRFTRWTANAIGDTRDRFESSDERLVFVNAWNEWAEGAHLEPDEVFGYAWLESIRVALARNGQPARFDRRSPRILLLVDATRSDDLAAILDGWRKLPGEVLVVVAATADYESSVRSQLKSAECGAEVHVSASEHARPPLLLASRQRILAGEVDVIMATAPESVDVSNPEFVDEALVEFTTNPRLGVVLPTEERAEGGPVPDPLVRHLGDRLGLDEAELTEAASWRATSYVARAAALAPILCLSFDSATFDPDSAAFEAGLGRALDRSAVLGSVATGLQARAPGEATGGRNGVVIVSHDAHPHGAQRLALSMARGYRDLGLEVHLVVLGPGPMLETFGEVATVHEVDLDNDSPAQILRLLRALADEGARFALANTAVSGPLIPLLRQVGLSTVSLIHELPELLREYGLQRHAEAIVRHADEVVFPAELVRRGFEEFVGHPLRQATVRPQGLYLRSPHRTEEARLVQRKLLREHLHLDADACIVLGVGYADHRKGIDLFIDAGRRILSANSKTVLVWVGKDGDRELTATGRAKLADDGFENRFILTGLVENPEDYYAAADVYMLTSREDPFPSVVLEALHAELPVVAFADTTGSEDVLVRDTGVLVPAFDTVAMANAAGSLLSDRQYASTLGSNGRNLVDKEFNFQDYLHDLAALAGHPVPRVSVVVPNYNYADLLPGRLESIRNQTTGPYELIVLDDASTDHSRSVIKSELAQWQGRTSVLVNERNSGSVFEQWRRGVELAAGDLVWIAEADDLSAPEFLSELVPAFDDPDVVMAFTQSRQMAWDGTVLSDDYLEYVADLGREKWQKRYVLDGRDEISSALFCKNTIPNVSGALFRRDALQKVLQEHGDEIVTYRNAGDWVTYLRLLSYGKIAFSPRSLNLHRRHQASVTIAGFDVLQLAEIMRVQRETIERFSLTLDHVEVASAYAEQLYRQFGLATEEYPTAFSHPKLMTAEFRRDEDGT